MCFVYVCIVVVYCVSNQIKSFVIPYIHSHDLFICIKNSRPPQLSPTIEAAVPTTTIAVLCTMLAPHISPYHSDVRVRVRVRVRVFIVVIAVVVIRDGERSHVFFLSCV
mmetsp:Transcript_19913/g.28793  ORF Transcript_19913/g.28793 Transcript_19913/m.28793 type:complete len:109 (-) Transcript_19913:197-523(-)